MPEQAFTAEDIALTQRIGILDAHNDYALALTQRRFEGDYESLRSYWLPRFRAGGVKIVVSPVYIGSAYLPEGALRQAIQVIDGLVQEIDENHDQIELAQSAADIQRINAVGKIAALLAFEGAEPLGQDLSALRLFHRVGLRLLSFTWMRRTAFGDGTWENETGGGLSRLGREAVREMNRLGIVVDVSHASDRTTWDILEMSAKPVIASHSNARALQDHPRNVTDDMIRAIAASGGVVGVVAVSRFITDGTPTIAKWADHIDHIIQVAGIDHVGIGADFAHYLYEIGASHEIAAWRPGGKTTQPPFTEMLSPEDLPGLTRELVGRGFGEADLAKTYHQNFLRVMSEVLI